MISFSKLFPALGVATTICAGSYSAFACHVNVVPSNGSESLGPAEGSEAGAIANFQTQILDSAIYQKGEVQAQDAGQSSGDAPPAAFPAGLGETWHDGYKSLLPNHEETSAFRTEEAAAFGSAFYKLPQPFLYGQLQLGVFAGYDSLHVTYSSTAAKSYNESFLFGGYGLYTSGSNYIMGTAAGAEGQTHDGGPGTYGTHGVFASLVGGHVYQLDGAAPLKLDVRGGVSYMDASGDNFTDPAGQVSSTSANGTSGSLSATLFFEKSSTGGALFRPYIKGEVREQFSYNNTIECKTLASTFEFGQADTTGVFEAGLDYVLPNVTFNASVYGEAASDQTTIGGKIGAKFKLN